MTMVDSGRRGTMITTQKQRGSKRRMYRFPTIFAVCSALCLASVSATAQVSFTSAVDLALRSDPRIKAAEANVDKAKAVLKETRDAVIPSVSATGGYGTSTGVPLGVPVVFSLASQSLLFNFAQKDNERAAGAGLDAAMLAMRESRNVVAEDVVLSYLNLDNLQHKKLATDQEYDFANRLVTITQDRFDAGKDSKLELLKARRTAAQIRLQRLQLDDDIAIASDHLARAIGLPGNKLSAVPGSVPALPSITALAADSNATENSSGVQAAFATAKSKQEVAFGLARYRFRPQVSFGANYSRINTSQTNYVDYYPGFKQKSLSAASIGVEIKIPLYDRGHEDQAREAAADARHAQFEAQDQRNQFLEGRFRLQHSASELSARSDLAEIDRDLAQDQLDAVLVQLSADSGSSGGPLMTPKDAENARLQERARAIDLLDAQIQLLRVQVNLMRQTGQLDGWLKIAEIQASGASIEAGASH